MAGICCTQHPQSILGLLHMHIGISLAINQHHIADIAISFIANWETIIEE